MINSGVLHKGLSHPLSGADAVFRIASRGNFAWTLPLSLLPNLFSEFQQGDQSNSYTDMLLASDSCACDFYMLQFRPENVNVVVPVCHLGFKHHQPEMPVKATNPRAKHQNQAWFDPPMLSFSVEN